MLCVGRRVYSVALVLCVCSVLAAAEPKTAPPDKAKPAETKPAPDKPPAKSEPLNPAGTPMFNGKDCTGWEIPEKNFYEDHGKVFVRDGMMVLEKGSPMTGARWTGAFPTTNYEVRCEAMRIEGGDFFCTLTFPVGDSFCTWVVGGWGGSIVGLSNVDSMCAVENNTTSSKKFEDNHWYSLRLRVTDASIDAWIDGEHLITQERGSHKFDIWLQQESVKPFGINTYYTIGAVKNMVLYPARNEE